MSSSSITELSTESLHLLLASSLRAVEMTDQREVHPDVFSARWDRWVEVSDELDHRADLEASTDEHSSWMGEAKPKPPFTWEDLVSHFNTLHNQR